jgi:hypothetical protein
MANRRKCTISILSILKWRNLHNWKDRVEAKYCTGQQCNSDYPYYKENGRIDDNQVIKEYIRSTEIVEFEDYKKRNQAKNR